MSRVEEMRELFAAWKESGKSLMAFGKQEGVSYAKLLYWRRKFERETGAAQGEAVELVPVEVIADGQLRESQPKKLEVWLANGVALDVPVGFDGDELRRLVDVLGSC